jgi:hypothetical protein
MFPQDFTDDLAIFVGPEFAIETELVHALVADITVATTSKAPNVPPSRRNRDRRMDKPALSCLTSPIPTK